MSDAFTPRALASVTPKKKPITVWEAADRIEALEAKLAKAVEALDEAVKWVDRYRWAAPWVDDAHATLAEIKGESHE